MTTFYGEVVENQKERECFAHVSLPGGNPQIHRIIGGQVFNAFREIGSVAAVDYANLAEFAMLFCEFLELKSKEIAEDPIRLALARRSNLPFF